MNPYLKKKRDAYNALSTSITELQTRAVAENRDLTPDELTLVRSQSAEQAALLPEIETLTEQENRSAAVAAMADKLLNDAPANDLTPVVPGGDVQTRSTSTTIAKDRDPGHYRSEKDGGTHSFFGDLYKAKGGDPQAVTRLAEHTRALATGTEGVGLVAPHWLVDEYAALARQGRNLANRVRNIPLGNDPRPITLPKQTAGTDANVLEQTNENDPTTFTNAFDTDVDTVIPKPTTGGQIVSRQMLDMATPAIDALIYGDLISAYNLKVEKKVGAAMVAAATVITVTFANEAAFNVDDAALDAVVDAGMGVWDARKMPADIIAMGVIRYGKFLKLKDADGRPLLANARAGGSTFNSVGSGNVRDFFGNIEGLDAIPTDGIGVTGGYPDNIIVARSADTILFEGSLMRFAYEQPLGPESVKMGVWAYTAVAVRYAPDSLRKIKITAA